MHVILYNIGKIQLLKDIEIPFNDLNNEGPNDEL